MSVTEHDLLDLAKQIGFGKPALSPCEATARSAASRLYYAAYHSTLEAFRSARPKGQFKPSHEGWTLWLRSSKHRELQNVGTVLEELRKLRVTADYELKETPSQQNALSKLRDAAEILAKRKQVEAAIKLDDRAAPSSRFDQG